MIRRPPLHPRFAYLVAAAALVLAACPKNSEDATMLRIYDAFHPSIEEAVYGTDIEAAYLAAIISLESHPPGNPDSERFEPAVYQRLRGLKELNKPYGNIRRELLLSKNDQQLREFATSYGLTQIMGYHCLSLGCTPEELKSEYHLQWAAAFMQLTYGKLARQKNWAACFRMHNTGSPRGNTHRDDYVQRGLHRMDYYREWIRRQGSVW